MTPTPEMIQAGLTAIPYPTETDHKMVAAILEAALSNHLILPLRWLPDKFGRANSKDETLMAGPLHAGDILLTARAGHPWMVKGAALVGGVVSWHATPEEARAALVAVVRGLGDK